MVFNQPGAVGFDGNNKQEPPTKPDNESITSLENEDSSNSNIDLNGYKLYVNGKAIN